MSRSMSFGHDLRVEQSTNTPGVQACVRPAVARPLPLEVPEHVPVKRVAQRIHTKSGVTVVTYHHAECACGLTFAVKQSGYFTTDPLGFNVSDEIRDAKQHFRGGGWKVLKDLPVVSTVDVCLDSESQAWTDHELKDMETAMRARRKDERRERAVAFVQRLAESSGTGR